MLVPCPLTAEIRAQLPSALQLSEGRAPTRPVEHEQGDLYFWLVELLFREGSLVVPIALLIITAAALVLDRLLRPGRWRVALELFAWACLAALTGHFAVNRFTGHLTPRGTALVADTLAPVLLRAHKTRRGPRAGRGVR